MRLYRASLKRSALMLLVATVWPPVWANPVLQQLVTEFDSTGTVTAEVATNVRQLADSGNPEAMIALAAIADRGLGISPNPEDAFNWYLAAAREGNSTAALEVATRYFQSKGTPIENSEQRNLSRGKYWLNQSAKALNSEAIYLLSQAYLSGELYDKSLGLSPNEEFAVELLKLASVLGHPKADYQLFTLLHRTDANLFDDNERQARVFLQRCLDFEMPECQYEMAKIKLTGDENIRNIEQGLELLRLSATAGYVKADNLLLIISEVIE